MGTPKVFENEYKFCTILWQYEPINSTLLVKMCKEQLGWSKSTTYTVIKRLVERGVIKNEDAIVSTLVSQEEIQIAEINELVEKKFGGSIPAFIATFAKKQDLTEEQKDEIRMLIRRGDDE